MTKSTAVHDNLTVTAMALEGCGHKVLFLSITTTDIDDEVTLALRTGVSEATGYDIYDINICPWQIHSGPSTEVVFGWSDIDYDYLNKILLPGCVKAAVDAVNDIRDVEIGIGTAQSDVGINRRQVAENGDILLGQNPYGPYDPTMTVVRFLHEGKPYANIIHYGAHPTAIGPTPLISRDWPGIMVDRVEKYIGGMTLYFNGAVGDVGPRLINGKTTSEGDFDGMYDIGYRAAHDAVFACRTVKEFRKMDLQLLKDDINIPYRPLEPKEKAVEKVKEFESYKDKPGLGMAEYMYWNAVLEEYENNRTKTAKQHLQTITRIGPLVMVPFPGEVFAEIVLRMRQHSPYQYTLSLATSNGENGYLFTRDSLHRGGYEVEVSKAFGAYILADNSDDEFVRENLRLLRRMKNEE